MNTPKVIMATGANGALGKELIETLPDEVTLISTSRDSLGANHLDITDLQEIQDRITFHKPDIIFHLAGIVPIPLVENNPDNAVEVNVLGLNNLFRAVEKINRKCKIVVLSSSEVYGNSVGRQKFLETDKFSPNNFYAFTKVSQEELTRLYIKRGLNVKIARIFNYSSVYKKPIYSLESFANQIATLIKEDHERTIKVGNLLPERDFLQGADVAHALYAITFSNDDNVIYNVCRGDVTAMHELLNYIVKAFGVEISVIKDESKFRLIDSMYVCGDNSRLVSLGWKPKFSVEEMIGLLVNYYKKKYSL